MKHPENGTKRGVIFINDHIIKPTDKVFDDFADSGSDDALNKSILGLK